MSATIEIEKQKSLITVMLSLMGDIDMGKGDAGNVTRGDSSMTWQTKENADPSPDLVTLAENAEAVMRSVFSSAGRTTSVTYQKNTACIETHLYRGRPVTRDDRYDMVVHVFCYPEDGQAPRGYSVVVLDTGEYKTVFIRSRVTAGDDIAASASEAALAVHDWHAKREVANEV